MGRNHYVKTDWGTLLPGGEGHLLGGDLCTDSGLNCLHHTRLEGEAEETGSEQHSLNWTICQLTKTLLLRFNPLLSTVIPLMNLLSTCFQREWEKQKGDREKEFQKQQEEKSEAMSWLWELYTICKPTGTLHKWMSLCIVFIVLRWYHLCFCKIIYSAKMLLFFSLSL